MYGARSFATSTVRSGGRSSALAPTERRSARRARCSRGETTATASSQPRLTVDEVAERGSFPMLESLAAAGRHSVRGVEDDRDRYRLHVQPTLGHRPGCGDVDTRELSELIAAMRARRPKPYAEATRSRTCSASPEASTASRARAATSARSPVDGLDPAERPRPKVGGAGRVLDEAELALLVAHASDFWRPAVTLVAYTGLRLSEALGLRWAEVDLVDGELHVRRQLQRQRGERPTTIVDRLDCASELPDGADLPAVEAELVRLLERELEAGRGRPGDLVFCTRTGQPQQPRNLAQRGVGKAAKDAGLGHVTPKDLRVVLLARRPSRRRPDRGLANDRP